MVRVNNVEICYSANDVTQQFKIISTYKKKYGETKSKQTKGLYRNTQAVSMLCTSNRFYVKFKINEGNRCAGN